MKLLHISDVHYGTSKGESRHYFRAARKNTPNPSKLATIINSDPALATHPDLVVVSGDVGWSGSAEDYEFAKAFLAELSSNWPAAEFIVVPGNHDVNWEDFRKGLNPQQSFLAFLQNFYGPKFTAFYPLFKTLPGSDFDRESLVSIVKSPSGALIVAVNSAAYLGDGSVPVYLSRSLLERVGEILKRPELEDEALRIFVMHHHLLPFAESFAGDAIDLDAPPSEPDNSIVANSGWLQSWLSDNNFHLILHGHKHSVHIRRDLLWRPSYGNRDVVIFGAGSAGVYKEEIPDGETLSYNVFQISRLARRRYSVHASIRRIDPNDVAKPVKDIDSYQAEVGPHIVAGPTTFHAEQMDDCHRSIRMACTRNPAISNFISMVDVPSYIHPATASIRGNAATESQVQESFRKLHPEYHTDFGWDDLKIVHDTLKRLEPRFRFEHGPRLFGIPGQTDFTSDIDKGPIQRALMAIRKHSTRAYAGLFNPAIDVLSREQPLPGLTGIQFIVDNDNKFLDLIATFRNLELSFWWVVNMYEMILMLKWAASRPEVRLNPRRITFFSPIAVWREDPEPNFVAELDAIKLSDLTRLVISTASGSSTSTAELAALILNKREQTSDANLDPSGLCRLIDIISGVSDSHPVSSLQSIVPHLQRAVERIESALENSDVRRNMAEKAREELSKAEQDLANH